MTTSASWQRTLERFRYWQGQMLRSADFRAGLNTEVQLRWWHNRSLHRAFGVSLGFEATRVPASGNIQAVQVEPGVAYDCFGRALILTVSETVPLPSVGPQAVTSLTLVVRYRETAEFPSPRDTAGVCLTCCGESEAGERPDFIWKPSDSYTPRDGVALARVLNDKGGLRLDPHFFALSTRPDAKPYLANGSTIPGSTAWSAWRLDSQHLLGLQTRVDTSTAGFTRVPCYLAWLQGLDPTFAQATDTPVIFTHIDTLSPVSFMFRILVFIPPQIVIDAIQPRAVISRRPFFPFYVCWLGCQPAGDSSLCLETAVEKPCCS